MAARFEPPVISDNPTGWGPSTIPAQFKDMVSVDFYKNVNRYFYFVQIFMHVLKHTAFDRLFTTLPCIQPYQPFSKSDRLGKVSDWTGATYQDRRLSTFFLYFLKIQYLKLHLRKLF